MYNQETYTQRSPYAKLFSVFFMALLVASAGLVAGQYIPRALFLPLAIVEIVMIIAMMFARKKKAIGYPLMFAFMFVSGAVLYPTIARYSMEFGPDLVLKAGIITAFAFGGTAIFAIVSKQDFRFLGTFLIVGLIALLLLMILTAFFPVSTTSQLILQGFGILIFIGYTLYDFSRLTKQGFTDQDIPMIVVSIYLDLINLFLFILRFMGISARD